MKIHLGLMFFFGKVDWLVFFFPGIPKMTIEKQPFELMNMGIFQCHVSVQGCNLPKFNMEPENHPFEKTTHFQHYPFWVPR